MRYVFAGDRNLSIEILSFIISRGFKPLALFVSSDLQQTHAIELINISGLSSELIFKGKEVNESSTINRLKALNLDYIIGIHFPYIISNELLAVPKVGFLNLHPAYLPYNKGWHTPSWAIIEGTPYGATLHFMSEELDAGDIIYQEIVEVTKSDTANTLYKKVLQKEFQVFKKSFEQLVTLNPTRQKQTEKGTTHVKNDLSTIQNIDVNKSYKGKELINLLRGLTTNNINESAYFIDNGKKYHIQVNIIED